jgi:UPF0176 protein
METQLINLTFYSFFPLGDLISLRKQLKAFCDELKLRGTILLAPEGINAGLTGTLASIQQFKAFSRDQLKVKENAFKEANVPEHSFKRMLVKIKKEIITVGDSDIRPDQQTGKRLSPSELKKWLDENRSFVLLDTRNEYEIEVGSFSQAESLKIDFSRQFREKAEAKVDEWKDKVVVTYCTGGIRCEKASAVLMKLGLKEVYQLDGGILRYFEEQGSAHFTGNCFVFDWRLAVDAKLMPTQRSENPNDEFGRHQL